MRLVLIFSIFLSSMTFGSDMERAKAEAVSFGQNSLSQGFEHLNTVSEEELQFEGECDYFEPNEAKGKLLNHQDFDSSTKEFLLSPELRNNSMINKSLDNEEGFLRKSDFIISDGAVIIEEGARYTVHDCQKPGEQFPVVLRRSLSTPFKNIPEIRKEVKICLGHALEERRHKIKDANNRADRHRRDFSNNEEIKNDFRVWVNRGSRYEIQARWNHVDDASSCDKYRIENRLIRKAKKVLGKDIWRYSEEGGKSVANESNCTLFRKDCLDGPSTKKINGEKVFRKCWNEELNFLCTPTGRNTCSFLTAKNCELIDQTCIEEKFGFCTLWSKQFKCFSSGEGQRVELLDRESFHNAIEIPESPPNESFAEVSSKLAIFQEIEREVEGKGVDVRDITYFSGNKFKCSKSIASETFYDCCFSYKGLATQVNLAKCNSEEIQLAKLRDKNSCYYVGKYEEKALGIKIKDHHAHCCFGSKLSKIIQVQGREQLGIGWGSPKKPNCRGLSYEEISQIDFSQLDLSELVEDFIHKKDTNFDQKIDDFRQSLQEIEVKMKDRWRDVS